MMSGVKVGERAVDSQSGFRAYSRRAIESIVVAEDGMGADAGILIEASKKGLRVSEVPVSMNYSTKAAIHSATYQGLDVFFTMVKFASIRHPFLFFGGFGIISLTISFAFGFLTIDYYQKYHYVVTNMALISVAAGMVALLSLFTGVLLFAMITVIRESSRR
jgi:hypothetical protein